MINFENTEIVNMVIHHIGNKFEGGEITLSNGCFLPEDTDVLNLLKTHFLSAFKKDAYYHFLPMTGHSIPSLSKSPHTFTNSPITLT